MNIYVGNLSYDTADADLQKAFEEHGKVESARVIIDKYTERSRGFGFVEMPDAAEAQNAIAKLNGTSLQGRDIRVNEARPREEKRGPGGEGRRNNDFSRP
jgi:RNA recognition motif-containing protein